MTEVKDEDRGRLQAALLRSDFEFFFEKTFATVRPGAPFLRNWHHEAIAHHLELLRLGKITRLIINIPPRSLKSVIASVAYPAFLLGHNPAERIICVSYAAELARSLANDFRAVLETPWYRRAFPGTIVGKWKDAQSEVAFTRHGHRIAASTEGTLTGRGGDYIIIDDPLKPTDANSQAKREACNQWFLNTLLSRLDDKRTGRIAIVMQRLHIDDLVGFVTRGNDDWTILSLPAEAEDETQIPIGEGRFYTRKAGELLHAEREPPYVLERTKRDLGSAIYAAQHQQAPVPADGAMVKRSWVVREAVFPPKTSSCKVLQSWDTASKAGPDNDWSVCTTWLRTKDDRNYLLDVLRGRYDYPTLKARAIAHARHWQPMAVLIEDAGTGTALIPELKREGIAAVGIRAEHDKIARMSIHSAKFEAGLVMFPLQAPWLADLEAELFAFPGGRNDDQVDSISQALAYRQRLIGAARV